MKMVVMLILPGRDAIGRAIAARAIDPPVPQHLVAARLVAARRGVELGAQIGDVRLGRAAAHVHVNRVDVARFMRARRDAAEIDALVEAIALFLTFLARAVDGLTTRLESPRVGSASFWEGVFHTVYNMW